MVQQIALGDILLVNMLDEFHLILSWLRIEPLPTSDELLENLFFRYFGSSIGMKVIVVVFSLRT